MCIRDSGSSSRFEGESPGINDKGLVTYDRKTPKDAYFFYRANWSPRPTVYITSRRFAERTEKTVPVKMCIRDRFMAGIRGG